MLKIGLTGGIGSGKSAVANLFAALGVSVIDADVIARDLVETGSPAYDAIIDAFGVDILRVDAAIDRGKLRKIIFDDPEQRKKLEAILHPLVRLKIHEEISQAKGAYCIVVIPLMVETGQMDLIDKLIVVDVPTALQVKRTALRDGVAPEDVEAIIRTQADRAARRSAADFVIENSGSLASLAETVKQLHGDFILSELPSQNSRQKKDTC